MVEPIRAQMRHINPRLYSLHDLCGAETRNAEVVQYAVHTWYWYVWKVTHRFGEEKLFVDKVLFRLDNCAFMFRFDCMISLAFGSKASARFFAMSCCC